MINEYTPYTYLIGWSKHNIWYYGSRYAKKNKVLYETGAHPDDLWVTYFTSSNEVARIRKYLGEPDIVKIRKIFKTEKAAREWEQRVLRRLCVITKNHWLNKTDTGGIPSNIISRSNTKRYINHDTKALLSASIKEWWSNRKNSKEYVGGNRKGRIKVKNIKTGERKNFNIGEYDTNEWCGVTSNVIYYTPFGSFTGPKNFPISLKNVMSYPAATALCNSTQTINHRRVNASKYLTKEDVGKCPKEIGFYTKRHENNQNN